MATVKPFAGTLNLPARVGQAMSQLVDTSIDLTGYTFSAEVVSAVTFEQVNAITVSAVNLAAGQINLGIGSSDMAAIAPGSYLWRLVWTPLNGSAKTAIEGILEVSR